jgi:iron complex outermembrane receptor protein
MYSHPKRPALFCSAAPAILVFATALAGAAPGSALAQTAVKTGSSAASPAPTDNSGQSVNAKADDLSEIVVTARKKSETLLEVPLAITALSSATLEKRNVQSLQDVASYTPSLNITSFGNSTTNRAQQTVIIRGMVPGSTYSTTTTVFINGAPLAASGLIDGISDVAQVEIVKGPQAAYFGRSTFGGAVNIITKAPGDQFKVTLDGLYGSYNWTDFKGTAEGAIVPGILEARVTGRFYKTDGYYNSTVVPGAKFGAQESQNVMGEFNFTPNSNLTVRGFGGFIKTNDGNQPFVKLNQSYFNCTPGKGGLSIYCGTLPSVGVNSPGVNPGNSEPLPSAFLADLKLPASGVLYNTLGLDHDGSASQIRVGTLNITYALPLGMSFSSVTAANDLYTDVIGDASAPGTVGATQQPSIGGSYGGAINQEFRLTSDQSQRLRGSFGVNYAFTSRGFSGASISAPSYTYLVSPPGPINRNNTYAVFGSVAFDLTSKIILNFEGRAQDSKTIGYSRTLNTSGNINEAPITGLVDDTKEFLPRAILQYKFATGHQVYASFAKGSSPGLFNTAFVTYSKPLQNYLTQTLGGNDGTTPEHLTDYEIGYKGEFLNRRLQVDLSAYYMQWRDQIILQGLYIVNQALTGIPGTFPTNTYSNNGATDLKGIEGNFYYRVLPALTLSGGGSINDTKILKYTNTNSAQFLGYSPGTAPLNLYNGNQLPYGSKYSANFNVDYTRQITSIYDGYFHGDVVYKSGQFGEPGNNYQTPDSVRVNLRLGTSFRQSRIEMFVENVFDNRAYLSTSPAFDQTNANQPIVGAVLALPRRIGVRFHTEL